MTCGTFDYDCSTPTPRSAFDTSGPLCDSLAEYLYEPANCDPGFFCGCSSTNPDDCLPTNDTSATRWGGHYTTKNLTTGEKIVLTGWFNDSVAACPDGYYCPGYNDPSRCVDLCEPKMMCENPSVMTECPKDGYCPVGSVTPQECESLETCNNEGQRRFKTGSAAVVIVVLVIVSIMYLYIGKCIVNKRAKEMRLASKVVPVESDNEEEGDDEESGEQEGNGTARQQEISRRRSSMSAPAQTTIDIEFERLRLTLPNVGTIMRGVSGSLKHGSLTAIMGPSGAGKTTFLSIMSGKVNRTGGILKVNGKEAELTSLRRVIGYVPQEDIMLRDLTVEENVRHSALMRLPTDWSHEKKLECVDEILDALEIDHVRDSIVGDERRRGISGGQRKRVNIALEMVTKPSLLCLDEPTSGLDSTTSLTVLKSLKEAARSGVNVVAVLHQPKYDIFQLFDQVLLLGQGGMTVYYGPADGMTSYFERRGFPCPPMANPADFYMDVLSGNVPHATNPDFDKDDLLEAWMCADENPDAMSPEEARSIMEKETTKKSAEDDERGNQGIVSRFNSTIRTHLSDLWTHLMREFKKDLKTTRQTPGYFKQMQLLLKRSFLQRLRTPSSTVLNIILMIIAGSVLPALVPDDTNLYVGIPKSIQGEDDDGYQAYMRQNVKPVDQIPGILMNIYMFLLIVSCLSVNVFGNERSVFFRETATGQLVFSYWSAKTLETFLWLPIYTAAFVLLGYGSDAWLLQPLRRYWLFLLLDLVGFYGFGMLASLLVGPGSAALSALVFGIIVMIAFSGTVNAYGDESPGFQNFINCWFLFWSTQGMCSEEYDQYRYAFDIDTLNDETPDKKSNDFGIGEQDVGAGVGMGFDLSSSYSRNVGFCALTAFAWHIVVLWTLKTKDHKKQR